MSMSVGQFTSTQFDRLLTKHKRTTHVRLMSLSMQELHRQIVSQTSEVRACIRTAGSTAAAASSAVVAAAPQNGVVGGGVAVVVGDVTANTISTLSAPLQQPTPSPLPPTTAVICCADNVSPPRKSDTSSLKGLETRYHMLYLQAIEVQCLLEGLLARKEQEEEEEDSVSAAR